jgi:hypothetical protein
VTNNALEPIRQIHPDSASHEFNTLVEVTERTFSYSSARVYHQTFEAWKLWAVANHSHRWT